MDDHPEYLLDRARAGGLNHEDELALRQHLAWCAICSAQLEVVPVTEAPSTVTAAERHQQRMVSEQVLRRLQHERTGRKWVFGGQLARPAMSRRTVFAAVLIASSGTAAAATWWSLRTPGPAAPASVTPASVTPAPRDIPAPPPTSSTKPGEVAPEDQGGDVEQPASEVSGELPARKKAKALTLRSMASLFSTGNYSAIFGPSFI